MQNIHPMLQSHASNPLPINLNEDIYRIFFSGRDMQNRSSVGFVDIDFKTNQQVNISKDPLICYGHDNTYYSHGISIGNAYSIQHRTFILFMGWNIPKDEHWKGEIGQLELINKNELCLTSEEPFMTVDEEDKVSLSYPFVMFDDGIYKMWYGSTISWESENGEMIHVIKYATSKDGVKWVKHGLAIPYELGIAQAFSRPTVIKDEKGIFHMWYSFRSGGGSKYKIGYARSTDGISWVRKHEELGLDVSETGWDSEMVCYPYVFKHKEMYYMLYNGNAFGKEGFGLATITSLNE